MNTFFGIVLVLCLCVVGCAVSIDAGGSGVGGVLVVLFVSWLVYNIFIKREGGDGI